MAADTALFVPPSPARRMVRKVTEIVLARLAVGRLLGALPFFPAAYTKRVMARRDHTGLYSGVFRTHAQALAAIPSWRKSGWDNEEAANFWVDNIDPVRPSSYPVFFWLRVLLCEACRVLDIGGSIGSTYYGYRRYTTLPAGATWTVLEVPKICRQGAAIAEREKANSLRFVSELPAAGPCELLLSAGALQYMDDTIPGLLESLPAKPRYILLNKLPITHQPTCWTLQNYGPAITPQQLFNEADFLAYFERHGYRLRDRWSVDDLDCLIPFHPERFIKQFTGFLFELTGQ